MGPAVAVLDDRAVVEDREVLALFPRAVLPDAGPTIEQFGNFLSTGDLGSAYQPFVPGANNGLAQDLRLNMPPERLVISSDCGMGREGMSRRHAQYKMVAMVLGTNIVRKELGLPEAECLAADPRYSLAL